MNQFDSMLPPGEQLRQCFNKSIMGLEMCWFGGGKKDDGGRSKTAKVQFKYDKKKYKYDEQIKKDQHNHDMDIWNAENDFQDEVHTFKTKERQDTYDHAIEVREFNLKEKEKQRAHVIKLVGEQQELNKDAKRIARADADQVRSERKHQLALKSRKGTAEYQRDSEQLVLKKDISRTKHHKAHEELGLKSRVSANKYEQSADDLELKAAASKVNYKTLMKGLFLEEADGFHKHRTATRDLQNKYTAAQVGYQGKVAEMAFEQASQQRELIKQRGKIRAFGQAGQSTQAIDRDTLAAAGQVEAQRLHMLKNGDLQQKVALYGLNNAMTGLAGDYYYQQGALALKFHSARQKRELQIVGQDNATKYLDIFRGLEHEGEQMEGRYLEEFRGLELRGEGQAEKYLNIFRGIRTEEETATGKSIEAAHRRMIKDISQKYKSAELTARAKIPLQPELGPPPLDPSADGRALPQKRQIAPPKPKKGVKPIKGAGYSGGGSVRGSSVGSVLGAASSAAMGLGTLGGMAASGGGAIGLGGLGTIGLGAMGPIGIGLGVIAGIGEVFDWW